LNPYYYYYTCKQIGDAGGLQSPLSFGGFAALSRHLPRLTTSITEAVLCDAFSQQDLNLINAYSPALSGAWMMQRAMSIPATSNSYNIDFVNRLLGGNFQVMAQLGDPTLKPFLQDVIQAGPMAQTLARQMLSDPFFVPQILVRVGLGPLSDWLLHYMALCMYTGLSLSVGKWLEDKVVDRLPEKSKQRFLVRRTIENWKYGAGLDYQL
jgi:lycopene cyclase CruP